MADHTRVTNITGGIRASEPLPAEAPESQVELFEGGLREDALPLARRGGLGIGRARGTPNRRTVAMRDLYLRSGYSHPMLWLGEIITRPVAELARELGCDRLDALGEQRKAAADLLPYLESRMPLNIHDDRERSPNVLIVGDVTHVVAQARQARQDGAMGIDDDVLDAVANHLQDQSLGGDVREPSHGEASHATTQGVDNTPENRHPVTDRKSVDDPPPRADDATRAEEG
jgi:hypothetical protein